ncbi:thiol:disulfide interchange protein DsbA/DsbL [Neisseria weixii]|uniref:Thiol:disulfide interchange protein DsbA n=1 Tax=Neisseria weixii TaxID=1853276 RepID=A0A3N4N025_9NEIS|nr:thiol:disulfide interchange protein DsbA/DsbL [Neisseria weixii]RPD87066.1 thiol:disulfide interchange protein DsbA/DsbL [Neisseria weixii]RPD89253.1 thiol:disulfide interchange protein DsbA/DsbL [Neisseria weixii]
MNLKKITLTTLTALALAACGGQAETSVPAEGTAQNTASAPAPAAPVGLVEGQNYTVLANPIPQLQAGKIEVVEFFGYFCPHCVNLEPVLSEHAKSFKDDTYLRKEHVVWGPEMKPFARLAAAVQIAGEKAADMPIFNAVINEKINLADAELVKTWLSAQTVFDGKKVLAAFQSPESQARADKMEELANTFQISSTPVVIVGGKYQVQFKDWQSGMNTVDLLVDKVREEQKAAPAQ